MIVIDREQTGGGSTKPEKPSWRRQGGSNGHEEEIARPAGMPRRSGGVIGKMHMLRRGTGYRGIMSARSAVPLLIALLIVACSGCIALEKDDDLGPAGPGAVEPPWSGIPQPSPGETAPGPAPSATESGSTVVPVDPVPVQPGEYIPNPNPYNVSSVPLIRMDAVKPVVERATVFEEQYSLVYSARGLQVDVVDVPFIITFAVDAQNPEPGAYSRLVVTVRAPETLQLIADEGYNGIYGSAREKSITLYRPGRYIVTLDGHFVDVKVTMAAERTSGS